MRIADPRPGYCSACYSSGTPERRYVDFEAAFDGAPVLDRESRTIAVIPWTGTLASHDDLYICETCLRAAAELLDLKPERNTRQLNEIKKQDLQIEHLKATVLRLQNELNTQYESAFGPARPQRRKVAA